MPVVRASAEPAASTPLAKTKKSKSRNGIEGGKEEKAKRKKTKEDKAAPDKGGVNLNDDLDFWLSASNGNDAKEKKVVTKGEMTIDEAAVGEPKKNKKDKKEKKEKMEKKEKREKKKASSSKGGDQSNHLSEDVVAPVQLVWKSLAEDKHLVMVIGSCQKQNVLISTWRNNFII